MKPRWRVQAFELTIPLTYEPAFFRIRWGALRQARRLRDSFAPGAARIEVINERKALP